MQIVIDDSLNSLTIVLETEDGYNPDVMDDLQNRAISTYTRALITRDAVDQNRIERELGGEDGA